jgi:hypothetical protein
LIVLDENILEGRRLLLEASRLSPRQIGVDVGRKGMKDDEIRRVSAPAAKHHIFHARRWFLSASVAPSALLRGLMNVGQNEIAMFVRRLLRHTHFDAQAKRMGGVIRVSHAGLALWRLRSQAEIHDVWTRPR